MPTTHDASCQCDDCRARRKDIFDPSVTTRNEAGTELGEKEKEGRQNILWGIVIAAIAGGITVGTFVAAGPGGTYFIAYGGVAVGGYQIIKGLVKASGFWRFVGLSALVAIVVIGFFTYRASQDTGAFYNSIKVGDCVDIDGFKTDCDAKDSVYNVVGSHQYDSDMLFPGDTRIRSDAKLYCSADAEWHLTPLREGWSQGDRTILCVTETLK